MSGNEAQDINRKIADILQSSVGANHYGGRKGRKRKSAGRTAEQDRRRTARKGSWSEAYRLHARLLFRLKKYGRTEMETALLQLLRSCKPSRRCASAACPKCTYAVQGVMTELIGELISVGIRLDACLTIIPTTRIAPGGAGKSDVEADVGKVERFRHRLDQALEAAGILTAIEALDFTSHEFPGGEFPNHTKPHLHALAFGRQVVGGRKVLSEAFPNKGSVNRAIYVKGYDGADEWLRYMLKSPNSRNIRKRGDDGKWADTAYKHLTVQQHLQMARILHELGWSGRLVLKGLSLQQDARGWRLVLTDFTPEVRVPGKSMSR